MSRRESVGRKLSRTQSASGPPVLDMVSVAVLPPHLLAASAPPINIGMVNAVSWDERTNWQQNEAVEEENEAVPRRRSLFRKAGNTAQHQKASDLPPFRFKQVPYDTWRKHYAKDKDGRYQGTHAPAEDCLLKPEDVEKWRLGAPQTKADLWTRGSEALPVYSEVQEAGAVPEYTEDYTEVPPDERRIDSMSSHEEVAAVPSSSGSRAEVKSTEEIIKEAEEEAKQKRTKKEGWKAMLKKGVESSVRGGGGRKII